MGTRVAPPGRVEVSSDIAWEAQYESGRRALRTGDVEGALALFDSVIVERPQFLSARLGRLGALLALRDASSALAEARFLIALLEERGDGQRADDIRHDVEQALPGLAALLPARAA